MGIDKINPKQLAAVWRFMELMQQRLGWRVEWPIKQEILSLEIEALEEL